MAAIKCSERPRRPRRTVPGRRPYLTRRRGVANAMCPAKNCDRPVRSNGYCHRHSENLRRYGNPIPQRDRPLDMRLREIGWTVTAAGCWEWNGKRNDAGYGIFNAVRLGYQNARAHRVMYEHILGSLPAGCEIRHRCDNPPCVNPDHLEPAMRQIACSVRAHGRIDGDRLTERPCNAQVHQAEPLGDPLQSAHVGCPARSPPVKLICGHLLVRWPS